MFLISPYKTYDLLLNLSSAAFFLYRFVCLFYNQKNLTRRFFLLSNENLKVLLRISFTHMFRKRFKRRRVLIL